MSRATPSHFRSHVEDHFTLYDLDVVCRKKKIAYNLYWADDEMPFARLRPTGQDDEVEIFWWDDDHWSQVGEFGLTMPLDEALEYITDDPQGLFFEDEDEDDEHWNEEDWDEDDWDEEGDEADADEKLAAALESTEFREGLKKAAYQLTVCTTVAGGLGGLCVGTPWGLAVGAAAGPLLFAAWNLDTSVLRLWFLGSLLFGAVVAISAATAGSLGACLTEALGGGGWARVLGLALGALTGWLTVLARPLAWLVAFSSGLAFGLWLTETWGITHHTKSCIIAALLAACFAKVMNVVWAYSWKPMGKHLRRGEARQNARTVRASQDSE